jgi:hypothetical protein
MKVVINVCFGGFGLSTAAVKALVARGCKAIKAQAVKEYTGGGEWSGGDHDRLKDAGDGFQVGWPEDVLVKDGIVYTYDDHERTDPDLIAVVEEMGAAANGDCASLKVVEIPDGIEWEIDEYDGNETVEEKHRSWS